MTRMLGSVNAERLDRDTTASGQGCTRNRVQLPGPAVLWAQGGPERAMSVWFSPQVQALLWAELPTLRDRCGDPNCPQSPQSELARTGQPTATLRRSN